MKRMLVNLSTTSYFDWSTEAKVASNWLAKEITDALPPTVSSTATKKTVIDTARQFVGRMFDTETGCLILRLPNESTIFESGGPESNVCVVLGAEIEPTLRFHLVDEFRNQGVVCYSIIEVHDAFIQFRQF